MHGFVIAAVLALSPAEAPALGAPSTTSTVDRVSLFSASEGGRLFLAAHILGGVVLSLTMVLALADPHPVALEVSIFAGTLALSIGVAALLQQRYPMSIQGATAALFASSTTFLFALAILAGLEPISDLRIIGALLAVSALPGGIMAALQPSIASFDTSDLATMIAAMAVGELLLLDLLLIAWSGGGDLPGVILWAAPMAFAAIGWSLAVHTDWSATQVVGVTVPAVLLGLLGTLVASAASGTSGEVAGGAAGLTTTLLVGGFMAVLLHDKFERESSKRATHLFAAPMAIPGSPRSTRRAVFGATAGMVF